MVAGAQYTDRQTGQSLLEKVSTMLIALNDSLERTSVRDSKPGENYYCQLCGKPVYPTTITDAYKAKRRRGSTLTPYIPVDKNMPCFAHKHKPCWKPFEKETAEHIAMKFFIANELHGLDPQLDYPIGNRITDLYLPDRKIAIECQSSQITEKNIREILWVHGLNKVSTSFIWGSRAFSRIEEVYEHRLTYFKMYSTVAEDTILSRMPLMDPVSGMVDTIKESQESHFNPRHHVYYHNRNLYWLHIFKKNRRLCLATRHPFQGSDVIISELNTDIGFISLFQKRRDHETTN